MTFCVGLTGGIASGKSEVSRCFAEWGVPIVDADQIARQLTDQHPEVLQKLVEHFGDKILNPDKTLDRRALRALIFENHEERRWLNAYLHPLIRKALQAAVQAATGPYVVCVIPLLLESNHEYAFLNRICVVDAPVELQLSRLMQRDGISEILAKNMQKSQADRESRLRQAHDVIENTGDLANLRAQVLRLHQEYLRLQSEATSGSGCNR